MSGATVNITITTNGYGANQLQWALERRYQELRALAHADPDDTYHADLLRFVADIATQVNDQLRS